MGVMWICRANWQSRWRASLTASFEIDVDNVDSAEGDEAHGWGPGWPNTLTGEGN